MTVKADESDAGGSSGTSSLSANYEAIGPDVDDAGQGEEEGVYLAGAGAGEGENEGEGAGEGEGENEDASQLEWRRPLKRVGYQ